MMLFILNVGVRLHMWWVKFHSWCPFLQKTTNPDCHQLRLLKQVIQKNQTTQFGERYSFREIQSLEQFQRQIPISTYEELEPWMASQIQGQSALSPSMAKHYTQTSGTTGQPKNLPIFPHTRKALRKSQQQQTYSIFQRIPQAFEGRLFSMVSPEIEGYLETGQSIGSLSGLLYNNLPYIVRRFKGVLNEGVLSIADYDEKYLIMAQFAAATEDVTLLSTANPSSIIKLVEVMKQRWAEVLDGVRYGNRFGLRANESRYQQLLQIDSQKVTLDLVWPQLSAITTWTKASCQCLISKVKRLTNRCVPILDLGYISTEFRGNIMISYEEDLGLPLVEDHFYEFVKPQDWENRKCPLSIPVKMIDEVVEGESYYVVVTNQHGLYRYFINDLVIIGPRYEKTPSLHFLRKGSGMMNLKGEKLSESQICQAVRQVADQLGLQVHFFVMLACQKQLRYELLLECDEMWSEPQFASLLDSALQALNIEFQAKRQSKRLEAIEVSTLTRGAGDTFKRQAVEKGQRENQYKVQVLQCKQACSFDFTPFLADSI